MEPFVSVIIPSFGGNPSLESSVDSALLQEYENFEIIVVDDNEPGSIGRLATESIMEKYGKETRVMYIKHDKNKNGAAARNTGVKAAKGKYIAFLDDDDRFLPYKLKRQTDYLECHPEYGAVYCWRYQGGDIVSSDLAGNLSQEILELTFTPCTPSIMMRTSCYRELNGFDEAFFRHQDFEFLLRFFRRFTIGVVKEPLVEIVGNTVNNQLQGKSAVALKKQFLSAFQNTIEEIDQESKGFKKRVWAAHYGALAVKLTLNGHFILLVQTYIQDGYKGGILFWKKYIGRLVEIFKYQFTKCRKQVSSKSGRIV
ncbi:glycosyltransferase [Clostridium sp. MCC353]|uniref:glycosyltransferase family 2 protein n=1 Tax=Clostridium sp. MCC353 TaxID=2592646 RepID=UPI001C0176B6|nr:glycosyltransferase family A protein [Clostridium sp. MCC353]MBT9779476.1 glycosyltransferase [Clostridium sp. MCC353]